MIDNQLIDKLLLEGEKDTHRIASLLSNEVEPGDVICLNAVERNNVETEKQHEFMGFSIIMLKNHMNLYYF